jgi:hypothetical protein
MRDLRQVSPYWSRSLRHSARAFSGPSFSARLSVLSMRLSPLSAFFSRGSASHFASVSLSLSESRRPLHFGARAFSSFSAARG